LFGEGLVEVDRMRRSWKRVAGFIGALILLALVVGGVYLYQYADALAEREIHPPRYPVAMTPADFGMAVYEDVSFTTSDGLTIRGWLIPGWNGATVILGHTHKGSRVVMLYDAATLNGQGYSVLVFDWRGQGLSDGDKVSFGQYEVLDVTAAVDHLILFEGIDPNRIGVMGESLGGTVMLLAAARDDRIKAVVSASPLTTIQDVADFQTRQIPFAGALTVQLGQMKTGVDASKVKPVDEICKISPRPVLLIYGQYENFLPPDTADRMFAAACDPKELWVVPGASHGGFRDVATQEFAARIVAFFNQHLLK
jgi:dipeptidyl aminopeptidase/acylaminoacyl peptidase